MYTPDFLIKPYAVHANENLRPSDGDVYAVIYWFEKLAGKKCTAGNQTIAKHARVSARSVRASLERLEAEGFIKRHYEDEARKVRTHIEPILTMSGNAKIVRKPQKPKKKKEKIEPPEWINKKGWEMWEDHRMEKGKPLTNKARILQWKMLKENEADHAQILWNSIMSGWTGLFPIKKTEAQKNQEREKQKRESNDPKVKQINRMSETLTQKYHA